jgi:hypothetical protein
MTALDNKLRDGSFTSSEIVALTTFGTRKMTKEELGKRPKEGVGSATATIEDETILSDPATTYIHECNMERRMGKPIDAESNARPLAWGKLVEKKVFEVLDVDYKLISKETIVHPKYDFWCGTPDAEKENTCGDIKAPFTLKSFCSLVDPLYEGLTGIEAMNALRFGYTNKKGLKVKKHADGEKFYWQIVSNATLLEVNGIVPNCDFGELIIFCPYQSEMESIMELAGQIDDPLEQRKYYFISQAIIEGPPFDGLPFILDEGYYKNLNIIRFEIPKRDKLFLERMVKNSGRHLIDRM